MLVQVAIYFIVSLVRRSPLVCFVRTGVLTTVLNMQKKKKKKNDVDGTFLISDLKVLIIYGLEVPFIRGLKVLIIIFLIFQKFLY